MNKLSTKLKWNISHYIKLYLIGKQPMLSDLNVLHLSDNFLVVNKQCDIPVNTDEPDTHPVTVADQLNHVFPHLADPKVKFGFRFCHRLDYSTSGILTLALNKNAAKDIYKAFSSRKIAKYYLALVHGHVESDHPTIINKPIGSDSRPEFSHMMCTSDKDYCLRPRLSTSKLCVLQRGTYNGKPASKLLMKLETGRRHQLRVHCHELGHTIVGDYTYSGRRDILPYRMFLHSFRLVLPCELETLDICTEDPFTEHEPRNKWCPTETVHDLKEDTFKNFEMYFME